MRTQSLILATSLTFLGTFAHAEGCFEKHLHDALSINHERRATYSRATNGASERISDALMALESRMLAYQTVVDYDAWSAPYEEKGIRISCDAVVPMSGVPPLTLDQTHKPKVTSPNQARANDLLNLWAYYAAEDDAGFVLETKLILARLEREPRIDCLYRHFLESILRIASLAPAQEKQASHLGLESPRWIHRQMILGHLTLLPTVLVIDRRAYGLNVAGIPIICNDVPRISETLEPKPPGEGATIPMTPAK